MKQKIALRIKFIVIILFIDMNLIETNVIIEEKPAEEELLRLLQFAPIRKIRDLIIS